jgi:competence protein ComGF
MLVLVLIVLLLLLLLQLLMLLLQLLLLTSQYHQKQHLSHYYQCCCQQCRPRLRPVVAIQQHDSVHRHRLIQPVAAMSLGASAQYRLLQSTMPTSQLT